MTASEIAELVDEGSSLDLRIKAEKKRLEEIKAALIELGAGEYIGESGRRVQIIQPSPAIKPKEEQVEAAREMIGDEPIFKKLFEKIVTWKAVKGFREIAGAILPKAKAAKVIETCEVECTPYVIFG